MDTNDDYVRALRSDAEHTDAYHKRSVVKSEQQRFLEELVAKKGLVPKRVADIACGGGSLTFHLRALYPMADFTLCDRDPEALRMARELNGPEGCTYVADDIHTLTQLPDASFDLVCCWQTLSWIPDPQRAVEQLMRIAAPGGTVYASSLFDMEHDVDIRAQLRDRTRASGTQGHWYDYNTFAGATVKEWLKGSGAQYNLHPFQIGIDLPRTGKGLGTYTLNTDKGRIQVSGGLLLNWAVLEIMK